ncbi:hypothetical protein BKA65DRAFT_504754 [Rhexocercosporidium sp. MPI-PUGE-AT-0058]|nr:hypothetical protein BKA65DRAFT_504754 [Rhexocercosporidium sp. MPI-PUGE-AT-0058]
MPFGDFPLTKKIAVVTGGGSGINLCFTELAVQKGARVLIADLRLTPEAEKFVKETDPKVVKFVKCDVTKRTDLENLITVSEEEFGDVPDVYIAGAGVFEPPWSNFWDDTEADRYAEVDININHPIKLSRIAIRALLRKNKKGVIVIVASTAGFAGYLAAPLYCATKHAMVGFVRSMAMMEEREGIKVVGVAPGIVKTPLWTPEKMSKWNTKDSQPEGYILPETVAENMASLVEDSQYVGGIFLETSASGLRTLGTWNIEAPAASTVANDSIEGLWKPALDALKRERGG